MLSLMNRLPLEIRAKIVGMMVQGNSLRSIGRMCGVSINTVRKLLADLGEAAKQYHDETVRGVRAKRLQCSDIWVSMGAKRRNLTSAGAAVGWGDVWTWAAIDADTKLCVSYLVGGRDADWAHHFMQDCSDRIQGRLQVTTVSHKTYLEAVEGAFGIDVDFAQLEKIYGIPTDAEQRRSSSAKHIGTGMKAVSSSSKQNHVIASSVERQNFAIPRSMRRFAGLTKGYSKRLEFHAHAVAIQFLYYNFGRIHETLPVTPALKAGLAVHVWTIEEIAALAG
jgi:IS1 family transposase